MYSKIIVIYILISDFNSLQPYQSYPSYPFIILHTFQFIFSIFNLQNIVLLLKWIYKDTVKYLSLKWNISQVSLFHNLILQGVIKFDFTTIGSAAWLWSNAFCWQFSYLNKGVCIQESSVESCVNCYPKSTI